MQPAMPAFMPGLPPEAYQPIHQQAMHPEMMQGMHAMPVPVMMGPMGPMMAAGPMAPGMMPPGAMAAPQLTQMLVDAARGGRSSNVFFKTRICNKWRSGVCPYGDKCTYAHGEHELRYVPPEIVAQLEAQQKLQDAVQQRQGGGGEQQQQREESAVVGGAAAMANGQAGGGSGGHQSFYKTRLCIKYMQTGYCHKGASCTFAHGYEDLRQPGTPLSPGRMPQDPMSPGRMAMAGGMPGGIAMMPAGMMPAGMMPQAMAAGRGMPMSMPMPMAMHMPPPPGRYPGQQQQRSPRVGGGGYNSREDAAGGARRRAAVMCSIGGVGEAGSEEPHPSAMQAAMSDVRTGAAFRESAYADSVSEYVQAQAQPQADGGDPGTGGSA